MVRLHNVKWIVLSVCLCVLILSGSFLTYAQNANEKPVSVLVLGSISRMMVGAYMVDKTVAEKLGEENINIVYMPYEDVTWDTMKKFNVLVLTMQPTIQEDNKTIMAGYNAYKKVEPLFYDFVEQGGGLYVFLDSDGYGLRTNVIVNDFLKPFGARTSYQRLYEAPDDCHYYDQWYRACKTNNITENHPATKNLTTFWYFGHGTFPLVVDDNWTVLVKSGDTTQAEERNTAYAKNTDPLAGPATPVIAARTLSEGGRIIVQASLASYHIQAGYHPKWEGWCLDNGGGLEYYRDSFNWLAQPSYKFGTFGGYTGTQMDLFDPVEVLKRGTPFQPVPPEKQPDSGNLYKGMSGLRLTEGVSVADFATVAKEEGFDYIIFFQPDPSAEEWEKLMADCEAVSDGTFKAIPGTEFDYEKGNSGFAFSMTKWPPERYWVGQLMLVMGANNGYGLAHANPVPPNLMGFFNLMEVYAYDKDLNLIGSQRDMFDTLTKYDWFPLPFANYRIEDPEKLRNFSGYCQYVLADDISEIEYSYSAQGRNSFLSNGPLVKSFWIEGAGVNDDYFEGRSYTWTSDDDVLTIHLDIVSPKPIQKITLFEDGEVMRKYTPSNGGEKIDEGYVFSSAVRKVSDQSNHTYWLVINDDDGGEAISKSLRTRGTYFWAHGGGDRANSYDGLFIDHPEGQFYWLGHQTTGIGGPAFDLSRGNMTYSCGYAPRPGIDRAPVCAYETGAPAGGLGKHQPAYPKLYTTDGVYGTSPHQPIARRYGYEATGGDVNIFDEDCFSFYTYDKDPETNQPVNWQFLGNDYFTEHNTYINYRWKAYGLLTMIHEKELVFNKDMKLDDKKNYLEVDMMALGGKDWSRDHMNGISFVDTAGKVIHLTNQDFRNGPSIMKEGELGVGGFVGVWPDPWGNWGIASLDDNQYDFIVYNQPSIHVGYEWPDIIIPAGTKLKSKHLMYMTPGTEAPDGSFQETFFKQFGFAGKPKWDMKLEQGYKVSERYETIARAENYGIKGTIANGLVLNPIPLRVEKINENWETGLVVPAQNRLRRTSPWWNHETAFFVLEPTSDETMDFYAGNLVLASRDFVKLALIKVDGNTVEIDAHNPTDEPVRVKIWTVDMAPVLPHVETEVELAPGEAKKLTLTVGK